MQIKKNIYQVGGSLNGITKQEKYSDTSDYTDANTYIVDSGKGLVMFDCGNGETLNQIIENMKYWNLSIKDVSALFITHPHFDHAGAVKKLKDMGIKVYAHGETANAIASGDERCCGYLYHKEFEKCEGIKALDDGETVSIGNLEITVKHYPGHTMGCTAYFFVLDDTQYVVSGDIIGTLLDGYFGWNGSIDFDKMIYLESLKRFSKTNADIMLPGHGMIYFDRPKARIENAFNEALVQWR